jgi:2-oxoglutarate dehydrogenase E2 component (dihydrolipoamide succinyltransferase)
VPGAPSLASPPPPVVLAAPKAAAAVAGERSTRSKMSPLRKRIAERLVSAQHNAAILTTFNEVDMGAVLALRKKFQEDFTARHGVKLGFMSFFVKAVVQALQAVPALNAQIDGDELVQNHYYDIGVAVGTDRGLMVPVVRDCDRMTLAEVEKAIGDLSKRARDGKIKIEDLQGGVFTISNGGIYGSMLSTPILNPPQSGILGLHNYKDRAMVVDGQIVARPMMYLALSYDHRVVDGKEAVTFLVHLKQAIEDPARLLFAL